MIKIILLIVSVANSSLAYSADKCQEAALAVAKRTYGNAANNATAKVIQVGLKYEVKVGGAPEDGLHTYRVLFNDPGCDPGSAQICDLLDAYGNATPNCN